MYGIWPRSFDVSPSPCILTTSQRHRMRGSGWPAWTVSSEARRSIARPLEMPTSKQRQRKQQQWLHQQNSSATRRSVPTAAQGGPGDWLPCWEPRSRGHSRSQGRCGWAWVSGSGAPPERQGPPHSRRHSRSQGRCGWAWASESGVPPERQRPPAALGAWTAPAAAPAAAPCPAPPRPPPPPAPARCAGPGGGCLQRGPSAQGTPCAAGTRPGCH
mmetsp:Transcript_46065/g.123424  ORF Transcript_46065/g.123424 Transcript_46065/m.123424 type:complete len:215 (+) Transcript_46065:2-646(+)